MPATDIDNKAEIRTYKPEINMASLIEKLGIDAEDTDSVDMVRSLAEEAVKTGVPAAMYRICPIDKISGNVVTIDGIDFESNILAHNLKDQKEVIAFIITCGRELDAWAEGKADMLEQFWAKAINEHILGNAYKTFNDEMLKIKGAELLSKMNPGSLDDWPLVQQIPLFRLLGDPEEAIGVTLSESCLMSPIKSVSGIMFRTEKEFINCMCCPRENCVGRRIPYDPHFTAEIKGSCAHDGK